MHMHTQRQLELARRAACRRGLESKTSSTQRSDSGATLTPQSSVDSNQSRGSLWCPLILWLCHPRQDFRGTGFYDYNSQTWKAFGTREQFRVYDRTSVMGFRCDYEAIGALINELRFERNRKVKRSENLVSTRTGMYHSQSSFKVAISYEEWRMLGGWRRGLSSCVSSQFWVFSIRSLF